MSARVRIPLVALALAGLAALACTDDKPGQLPSQPVGVRANELSAYVTVSNSSPAVGEQVTVAIRALRGASVGPIGSFTVRLSYDSTALAFVQAGPSSHGMVMTNARTAGTLVAAGASPGGFTDDELVSATFRVVKADALHSLVLKVSELNGSGFEDRRAQTHVERQLYRAK